MKVAVENLAHWFEGPDGQLTHALARIDLAVSEGEFVCILGPSGCGKTTLFNIIAGLLHPTQGRVTSDGRDISGQTGVVGYQLQKDLLLPWRTVLDNVILGLEVMGVPKREARQRVLPLMERYGLKGFEHHYPGALSGGMRQRVALMRTLLYDRDVILLDEPFAALDAQTRSRMQEWLLQVWSEFRKTVLFVTHDIEEAIFLADRIFVLSHRPARVVEEVPIELQRPRDRELTLSRAFIEIKRHIMAVLEQTSAGQEI